jgi:hypothetical protein
MGFTQLWWQTALAWVGAGITALITFWFGKKLHREKAAIDATLQREKAKLDALIEKSVYVQKAQFDKEYEIYSKLWERLCDVRQAIGHAVFQTETRKVDEKQGPFGLALEQLDALVEVKRPFYVAAIAQQLFELSRLMHETRKRVDEDYDRIIKSDLKIPHAETVRHYRDTMLPIKLKTDDVCEAIRERLFGVAVSSREARENP